MRFSPVMMILLPNLFGGLFSVETSYIFSVIGLLIGPSVECKL